MSLRDRRCLGFLRLLPGAESRHGFFKERGDDPSDLAAGPDGREVRDASGRLLGRVEGAEVRDRAGRLMGRVAGVSSRQAALYFFFLQ